MNLEELKGALSTMADEVQGTDTVSRLAEVDGKVRANRRRKMAGAGGAALAAGVAAAVLVVTLPGHPSISPAAPGDRGHHPAGLYTPLPTKTDDDVRFYTDPGGYRLVAEGVSRPGQHHLTLTFTSRSPHLIAVLACSPASHTKVRPWVELSKSAGSPGSVGVSCSSQVLSGPGSEPLGPDNQSFGHLMARAGHPTTVRVTLQRSADDASPPLTGATVAVAVYADDRPAITDDGIRIDEQKVYEGHLYRLVAHQVAPLDGRTGRTTLKLPASETKVLVTCGGRAGSARGLTVESSGAVDVGFVGSGMSYSLAQDGTSVSLTGHVRKPGPGAKLVIAAYRLVR